MAWQDRRELGSRPQALSSKSSSMSSAAFSELKPSRKITWQVVQAQDFSQACSICTSCCNSASQIEMPGSTLNKVPLGHSSSCGNTIICGITLPQVQKFSCRPGHVSGFYPYAPEQVPRLLRSMQRWHV